MFAVSSVKDLGTVNIYVDIWSTKHSRSKMHIWVTPAEAWHFYWGNLTSHHLLSPCKGLLPGNRSWEIFGCLFLCCWCCRSTLRPKLRCRVAADNDTIPSPAFAPRGGLWHSSHPQLGLVLRDALQTAPASAQIKSWAVGRGPNFRGIEEQLMPSLLECSPRLPPPTARER